MVGANCAIFKNMVAALEYYDLKGKEDNEDKARTIWTELMVTFQEKENNKSSLKPKQHSQLRVLFWFVTVCTKSKKIAEKICE